jgi:hypothetical protein
MTITTAIVCLAAMVLIAVVITLALYTKGSVKAAGTIGPGSFFIEASVKRRRSKTRGVTGKPHWPVTPCWS